MIEELRHVESLLDRIDQKLGKSSHGNEVVSQSNINVNGGGWINAVMLVLIGALALSMFILYLSDRKAAAAERDDFRQQARMDIQRLDSAIKDQGGKVETQQAYINEIYRNLKKP